MRRVGAALIALTLVVASCGSDAADEPNLVASDLERSASTAGTDEIAAVARAQQEFAAALYEVLAREPGNFVFSPTSIHVALVMALAGADGDTAAQMAAALAVDDLEGTRLHDAMNALDAALDARNRTDDPGPEGEERTVELAIANALWGQSGFPIDQAFLDLLATNYGAGMRVVDFVAAVEDARSAINAWVAGQTNDRIPELIPVGALNELTRLVITNAVYLDATWDVPFSPDATVARPFTLLDGTEVDVPTMHGARSAGYARGDGWQAVDLAYTGGELSLLVIVPDEGRFAEVERRLSEGLLDEARDALAVTRMQLSLPKFAMRTQAELVSALGELGMRDAFDPGRADFTGISVAEPLYVSGVLHEAYIAVDEAGTEAAAATAVVIGTTSAPIDEVRIDVDRPFLFVLQDRDTGSVLFLGRVVDLR